jgi:hypothetical protein
MSEDALEIVALLSQVPDVADFRAEDMRRWIASAAARVHAPPRAAAAATVRVLPSIENVSGCG